MICAATFTFLQKPLLRHDQKLIPIIPRPLVLKIGGKAPFMGGTSVGLMKSVLFWNHVAVLGFLKKFSAAFGVLVQMTVDVDLMKKGNPLVKYGSFVIMH